jgi:GNAT superfamily N-acetyltransferase
MPVPIHTYRMVNESSVTAHTLGKFFAANVTPAYISHGEVFCGRAKTLTEWVPNLVEVVAQEVKDALTVDRDTKQVWVAFDEERLVGLAIVSVQSEEVATLDDIVVVQGDRSKGYGDEFFRAILTLMRQDMPRLRALMCESGLHNEGAHRFIERVGFAPISKVFCYTFSED